MRNFVIMYENGFLDLPSYKFDKTLDTCTKFDSSQDAFKWLIDVLSDIKRINIADYHILQIII